MNKEQFSFGDTFKIHPIKTQIKIPIKNGIDNFREFQRLYGPLFTNKYNQNKKLLNSKSITEARPQVEIKTIQLEMPRFGSESAVINPKQNKTKPAKSVSKQVKTKTKEQCVATSSHALVKKLSQMEHSLRKDPKVEIHQTASTILDITNKELEVANQQLAQIKKLIELKQVQTQTTKPPPSSHSHKIKNNRHKVCHQKKYLTTLQSMQKKLFEMEKNYFKKPQVMYKSVNDTFTQFSKSVETIFPRQKLSDEEELDQTLKVAISELEDIVNTDISKKFEIFPKYNYQKEDLRLESKELESDELLLTSDLDKEKSLTKNIIQTAPVSSDDSVGKYFNQIHNELMFKKSEQTTISPFCHSSDHSKPIEDFLAGKDLDETSSKSSLSPRQEQLNHVKIEHVLAKDWSGDHGMNVNENCLEQIEEKKAFEKFIGTLEYNVEEMEKTDMTLTYSFKKQYSNQFERNDYLSKVIDVSEKRLSRYRNLKQDVIDVNAFCNTLRDIVTTDDEEEDKTTDDCMVEGNIFEESKLQESVSKSCYLMKEFNIKPKVFREESSLFCNKNKFLKITEKCSASGDKNMNSLLENLQQALENSVYTVDTKHFSEVCESNVVK